MPKTAIVTGAAGGIGRSCVEILRNRGVCVVAIDRQAEPLHELARSSSAAAAEVSAEVCDLADPAQARGVVDRAAARLGRIEAFLHFAAAWTGTPWDQSEEAEWDRILAVNLTGAFVITQAVAQRMVADGGGAIVLTGSASAKIGGVAGGPAYVASKGGIIALTRSMARALGPKGVRVNAVNPGVVDTPMTRSWPEEIKKETVARTPLGRLARPDDIASVACFLAGEDSRFMTGEVVEVNGGFYFD